MAAPSYVGNSQADGGSTGGNTYTNNFSGISLQDGDYLVWALMVEVNSSTLTTTPSGWTQRFYNGTVGSRTVMIYDKVWHTGDAASLSYVKSTANADGNMVMAFRGVSTLIYGTGQRRQDQTPTNSFTNTALGITTTVADTRAIFLSLEATSAAETSTFVTGPTIPSGWTQDAYKAQGTTIQTITLAHKDMPTPGATGDAIVTYQNTQASNGWAAQIGLVPNAAVNASATFAGTGAFSATVTQSYAATAAFAGTGLFAAQVAGNASASATFAGTGAFTATVKQNYAATAAFAGTGSLTALAQRPIDKWIATTPMFVAHRGGSVSWQQHTMNAYDNAVAWNPNLALEVSVWKSSDGVWVCNHDQNTGTTGTWNASYDIPTTTWATLSTVRSTVGNYPMIRLSDLLTKYGSTRIFFIEDKPNVDQTGFLNLLDSFAGSARYVVKQYYDNHAMAVAAHARGYKTWGYYYNADVASSGTTHTDWDILGLETSATTANWNIMKAYGQPILAHIIQNTTQYASAQAQSPNGFMVADVINVVPQGGVLGDFTGTGAFTAAVTQSYAASAAFGGTGTLTGPVAPAYSLTAGFTGTGGFAVTATQAYAVSAPFTGIGTFSAGSGSVVNGTAPFSGTGSFTAAVTQTYSAAALFGGTGSLASSIKQAYAAVALFGGTGVFTVSVALPSGGYDIFMWDGSTLIPLDLLGVWDGSVIIPADILEIV
jgi:hypothetical protein